MQSESKLLFEVRGMQKSDIRNGFLETLSNLRNVNMSLYELQEKVFDIRKSLRFNYNGVEIPVYYTAVAVSEKLGVFATATLFIELKHIHDGGLAGRIEDVARRKGPQYEGLGAGKACVAELIRFGREKGCYKEILDGSEKNVPFYESLGFKRHEIGMRLTL